MSQRAPRGRMRFVVPQEGQTILVTEFLENGDLYNAIHSQHGGRYHWYRLQQPDGRPVPNSGMARVKWWGKALSCMPSMPSVSA